MSDRQLLDTKFGTIRPDSLEEKTGKSGKPYLTATMVTGSGKEVTVFAHGPQTMETLREKVANGEPTFVTGELLGGGKGISASKFEPTTYTGKILEIGKEGTNDSGPWASVKMAVEGREKPFNILVTGEDVARVKAAGSDPVSLDVVWTAGKSGETWRTSARSASDLMRAPRAAAGEPEVEAEADEPGL